MWEGNTRGVEQGFATSQLLTNRYTVKRLRRARVRDSLVCVPPRWIVASLSDKAQDLVIKEGGRGLNVVAVRYYCVGQIVASLNKL